MDNNYGNNNGNNGGNDNNGYGDSSFSNNENGNSYMNNTGNNNSNQYGTDGAYQPQNQNWGAGYQQNQDSKGQTSQILGIVSIVAAILGCCCGPIFIAGIVTGILAIVFSRQSVQENGGVETQAAKTGKICGIIGIVLAIAILVVSFALGFAAGMLEVITDTI